MHVTLKKESMNQDAAISLEILLALSTLLSKLPITSILQITKDYPFFKIFADIYQASSIRLSFKLTLQVNNFY